MSQRSLLTLTLGVLVAAGAFGGGLYLRQQLDPPVSAEPAPGLSLAQVAIAPAGALEARTGARPDFAFIDQDSHPRRLSDWDGQVIVVNFWATWCPPCVEEIPAFSAAQAAYADDGVQFIGIALDDLEDVKAFIERYGLNYPTAAGDESAFELMQAFGNVSGGLPYTAVIDRASEVSFRRAGPMTREQLDEVLVPLIETAPKN